MFKVSMVKASMVKASMVKASAVKHRLVLPAKNKVIMVWASETGKKVSLKDGSKTIKKTVRR